MKTFILILTIYLSAGCSDNTGGNAPAGSDSTVQTAPVPPSPDTMRILTDSADAPVRP